MQNKIQLLTMENSAKIVTQHHRTVDFLYQYRSVEI